MSQTRPVLMPSSASAHSTDSGPNPFLEEETLDGRLRTDTRGTPSPLPWWKTPSPLWLLCLMPVASIAGAVTITPRIQVYTILVCKVYKPDIFVHSGAGGMNIWRHVLSQHVYSLDRNQLCASDPVVQAAVAKLIAGKEIDGAGVIAACTGILSCLTGAWWGAFSDRYGRTSVLVITVTGALVTDLNFVLVTLFTDMFPGGYWFLIAGPLIEGALGGLASGSAASHGYMADTTTEGSRSRIFSLSLGLLFIGIALGPTIGSLLVRSTGQVLVVFILSASVHLVYALVVAFIVPESLTEHQMQASRKKYVDQTRQSSGGLSVNTAINYAKGVFRFLAPLAVLMPKGVSRRGGKDWSLALVVLAYGLGISLMGSTSYVLQYTASAFGWGAEALGYYVTLVGATRATVLMVIFPAVTKYFRPAAPATEASSDPTEDQPLLPESIAGKELHSPNFDLNIARTCLALEVIAYGALSQALGPIPYTLFAVLGSFGACFSPALQSAALAIYTRNGGAESGRLFGAISVVQALCAQIIAPSVYGFVYAKTVAWFPRSIFLVTGTLVSLALLLLSFVRLPKSIPHNTILYSDAEASAMFAVEEVENLEQDI